MQVNLEERIIACGVNKSFNVSKCPLSISVSLLLPHHETGRKQEESTPCGWPWFHCRKQTYKLHYCQTSPCMLTCSLPMLPAQWWTCIPTHGLTSPCSLSHTAMGSMWFLMQVSIDLHASAASQGPESRSTRHRTHKIYTTRSVVGEHSLREERNSILSITLQAKAFSGPQ